MTTALIQPPSDRRAPKGAGSEPALLDIVKSAEVCHWHLSVKDQREEARTTTL